MKQKKIHIIIYYINQCGKGRHHEFADKEWLIFCIFNDLIYKKMLSYNSYQYKHNIVMK